MALLAVGIGVAIGPRNIDIAWDRTPTLAPLPQDLAALEAQLAADEARFKDLIPQTEKHIVWGAAGHQRAPWAVVYLHGFTATRQEMAPLPEELARRLGGHTFYTRLGGHGRSGAPMADASIGQWKADALEALQVGQRLGERVLVIGNSTGATLAAWLAQREESKDVAAWVMLSPNFGLQDRRARLINWPWGRRLALWLQGPEIAYQARDAAHARYWTQRFPTEALFPMMALVQRMRESDLESIHAPTLMMVSPRDTVIDVAEARQAFERLGSAKKQLIEIDYSESPGQHVLAGALEAPQATEPMVEQIEHFISQIVDPAP